MQIKISQAALTLVQGDITKEQVDAIVNAANEQLMGGGALMAQFTAPGGPTIMAECNEIRAEQGGCPTGNAVITTGGNLPAKHVIHTVGPIWRGGNAGEPNLLARLLSGEFEPRTGTQYQDNCVSINQYRHLRLPD